MYGGNFENWRYSPLADINRDNVKKLQAAWLFQTGVPGQLESAPVVADGILYLASHEGAFFAFEAKTGKVLYEKEIVSRSRDRPVYASPVLVNGRIYCVTRKRGTYVFAASSEFKQLANNRFANDESDFNASPAVSDGQIFIRSNQFLYCIEE